MPTLKINYASAKRGDTIIEVMFAIAVFCLVAVLSITMMNLGVNSAENALELVTARNELNAQAEALRFIHSSYISEKTLPLRSEITDSQFNRGEKYQQYEQLWNTIVSNAISPAQAKDSGLLDLSDTVNSNDSNISAVGCERVYESTNTGTMLSRNNAFILNTRNLSSLDANGHADVGVSYISARANPEFFSAAPLNARILFTTAARFEQIKNNGLVFDSENDENSSEQFTDGAPIYRYIAQAEGIWVIAVTDGNVNPQYYDFYIESCWYGPNTTSPTALDTVIRLYNPENVK